jgi:ABC-type lipoprotein export system ATPase subunit
MIKIEGLTKKYHSRRRSTCVALDSLDLVLPERGMVFVIGKSGSGKSTLLNLLGVVILSSLLTTLVLRSIKPVEIIKAKE